MNRFRWLQIEWGQTRFSSIAELMLRSEYLRGSTLGFRLEKNRNDEIIGRFIEHRQIIDEIRDPFGQLISSTRDIFDVVRFRLTKQFPELELQDAPRHFSTFATKLAECANFNISITPFRVNIERWAEGIKQELGATIVTAVTSSTFPLGNEAVARFSVGGPTDVRQQLHHFAIINAQYWDKARLKTVIDGKVSEYEISSRGTVCFRKGLNENLLRVLRSKISTVVPNG
jgi:hypothetical protein